MIIHYPRLPQSLMSEKITKCVNNYENSDIDIISCSVGNCDNNLIKTIPNAKFITEISEKSWINIYKIKYYLLALKESDKKYVLLLDSRDVVVDCTVEEVLDKFKKFNCDILISYSDNNRPNLIDENININSGCIIGNRTELIKLYQYLYDNIDIAREKYKLTRYWASDEVAMIAILKGDFESYGIKIDYNSDIFLTINTNN